MPDPRITQIEKLIADYEAADKDMTEANVEAAFVARLFAILGWATDNPTVWNRQVFVRGGGFADVGLQIQNTPVLFLEAKRFGKLKGPAKTVQAALFGDDVVLSQADRQRSGIDRTPEEKQAMRYARAREVPWAVLTNFERLVLFDANLARVAQLMADFRAQCPPKALHLSELERTLQETDAEIDRRVYDLYGLTEAERQIVEESVR